MLMKHLVVRQVVLVVMLKRNIERVLDIVVEDNDVQFEAMLSFLEMAAAFEMCKDIQVSFPD